MTTLALSTGPRPAAFVPSRPLMATAAVGYSLAWLVGLAITSSGTTVSATAQQVLADLSGREGVVAVQYLVTEVLTAIALVVTLRGLARVVGDAWIWRLGLFVGALSFVQGVLGTTLALHASPAGDADLAGVLFASVARVDGVKMLALAVLGVLGVRAALRRRLPRWLGVVAALLAASVAVSGVGYLFLVDSLALAAYVSLPVLMLWVTGAGLTVARRRSGGR